MKTVALLRGYPKDATYLRSVRSLAGEYRVICFLWDRQGDFRPPIIHPNITYRLCKTYAGYHDLTTFLKIPLFNLWLLWQLLSARIDRIHAIDLDTGIAGFIAALLKRKKFVYQCIDPYYAALPKNWPHFLARLAMGIENFVITHSDLFVITDMLRMPQHKGAQPKQVVEFANVMPLQLPHAAGERIGNFVVGYIGSLNEGRNLFTLIEAASELKEEGVTLVVGGFGKLETKVQEQSERFENVTFIPWVTYERLLELESGFDVLAIVYDKNDAAHRWASPNKFFEGMALGKPVIVGEGTIAEQRMMTLGNGLAVPYGSKEELIQAILHLKQHPEQARQMGERGTDLFLREYNLDVMSDRLLKAYGKLDPDTKNAQYTERLVKLEPRWKKVLDVQRPYRKHLKSLKPGFVLDIGCGLGRNLINLGGSAAGVGIDHNLHSIEHARSRGLTAFTPEEFSQSAYARAEAFDSIILSHIVEHMTRQDAVALLNEYLPYLRSNGQVILITPQERGYRSDHTHVEFTDFSAQTTIASAANLIIVRQYSFPLPRMFGHIFTYNEFITICRKGL